MHGSIPPLPRYVFMAWCLVKQVQLNLSVSFGSNGYDACGILIQSHLLLDSKELENMSGYAYETLLLFRSEKLCHLSASTEVLV
jgi:hypothetical protein